MITQIVYANTGQTAIIIRTDDCGGMVSPWPCTSWLLPQVDDFLLTHSIIEAAPSEFHVLVGDVWQFDLAAYQQAAVASLYLAYAADLTGGFESSALGAPYLYSSTQEAQTDLIGAANLGVSINYRCTRVADGVEDAYLHTNAQMRQVYADGATVKVVKLTRFADLKAQILAATTQAGVDAVIW